MIYDPRFPHLTRQDLKQRRAGGLVAIVVLLALLVAIALGGMEQNAAPVPLALAVDTSGQPLPSYGQAPAMLASVGLPGVCSQAPLIASDCLYY